MGPIIIPWLSGPSAFAVIWKRSDFDPGRTSLDWNSRATAQMTIRELDVGELNKIHHSRTTGVHPSGRRVSAPASAAEVPFLAGFDGHHFPFRRGRTRGLSLDSRRVQNADSDGYGESRHSGYCQGELLCKAQLEHCAVGHDGL